MSSKKQLDIKTIFETLNAIKNSIGLATIEFIDNQISRDTAINKMEIRFCDIKNSLDHYFELKEKL